MRILLFIIAIYGVVHANENSPLFQKSQKEYLKKYNAVLGQYQYKQDKLAEAHRKSIIQLARTQIAELDKIILIETPKGNLKEVSKAKAAIKTLEKFIEDILNPPPKDSSTDSQLTEEKPAIPPEGLEAPDEKNGITVTCDNVYQLYLNGKLIGSDNKWETAEIYKTGLREGDIICIIAEDLGNGRDTVGLACLVYDRRKVFSTPHNWYYTTEKPDEKWFKSSSVENMQILKAIKKPKRPINKIKHLEQSSWAWSEEANKKLYLKFIVPR